MNDAPVEALPLFVTVAVNEVALPVVAEVGVTPPAVRSGWAGAATTTAVQAPQLLFSLLSVMVPVPAPDALSAQTRKYLVVPASPAGNV